jgi:hypothetical protein
MRKCALLLSIVLAVSTPAWGDCRLQSVELEPYNPPIDEGSVTAAVTFQAPANCVYAAELQKSGGGKLLSLVIHVYCSDTAATSAEYRFDQSLGDDMEPGLYFLYTILWFHSDASSSGGGLIVNRPRICGIQYRPFWVVPPMEIAE